jgi:predicted nucleic acid-binding protein
MIILDTNVVSEILRPEPAGAVLRWIGAQPQARLFTTSISEGEILYGIALLADGKRRRSLESSVHQIFVEEFAGRILPFDSAAAREFAAIMAARRRSGRPMAQLDAQIAAIARSRGASVATRNGRDFEDCDLDVIDPWSSR